MEIRELTKADVRAAVERTGPPRVPTCLLKWFNHETHQKYGEELTRLCARFPEDMVSVGFSGPAWDSVSLAPARREGGIDSHCIIPDYSDIEGIAARIRALPNTLDFEPARKVVAGAGDRFCLGNSWFCLYERLWTLRGMENILADFHEYADELAMLADAIADFHVACVRQFGLMGCDAVLTSDDLGTQTSLMMSPTHFRRLLKPLFARIIAEAHRHNMTYWLHTCGNVTEILDDFVEVGLDVIHPIQHSTYPGGVSAMDPEATAKRFGGKITFLAGADVQYLLPLAAPEEVCAGIRRMIDTFDGPYGGMLIGAGNAIMPETSLANIEAYLEEAYRYGQEKREHERRCG
jgi:uroporphyrinogen decarboxylase